MPESIANSLLDPSTTLNGAITNVSTTINVHDASEMPTSGSFRILVWNGLDDFSKEVIKIASRSGNALTVATRAVEGPNAAQSHADSSPVEIVLTAQALNTYINEQLALFYWYVAR